MPPLPYSQAVKSGFCCHAIDPAPWRSCIRHELSLLSSHSGSILHQWQIMDMLAGANRALGINDKVFVLVDSVLLTGLGRIALMPALVLAAKVCPEVSSLGH